jgi:maleamate amidohydrolase
MALESRSLSLGSKPALIVVDVVNGFTDPSCALGTDCPEVVSANKDLLDEFRRQSLPIFFTSVVYHNQKQASVFRQKIPALECLKPGSHWVKIDPALERRASEPLIEKQWASSFFTTDLADQLVCCGADSLVVTGLTTSGCVRATAVDGLQHNYPVLIPREACGDRNLAVHEASLYDLDTKYADVISLSDLLVRLCSLGDQKSTKE